MVRYNKIPFNAVLTLASREQFTTVCTQKMVP